MTDTLRRRKSCFADREDRTERNVTEVIRGAEAECWKTHPGQQYAIRVEGALDATWDAWFDGMTLTPEPNGETTIAGVVADQCALHGLLVKVRDMHLTLVSVQRM
jgi:hypothetical protein